MEAERYRKAGRIFDAALERPSTDRRAFLDQACEGDEPLRLEVVRLIEHDRLTAGLLERSPLELSPAGAGELAAGTRLGNYRVAEVIGHGGMGVVYRATRDDDEFERQVAIKVVRQRGGQAQDLWRFQRERQILAQLEHPNIARLYDGGTTPEGQPFLVLEYVDGQHITAYCDQHRLPVEQRLELIVKVCSAVQFAHRNLVVHRDLKPSNILVDAEGEPKLLDFGIAKLLAAGDLYSQGSGQHAGHQATGDQQRVLTLSHASPEQVSGRPITTASDVYCLGLVLYELLCGVSPFAGVSSTPFEVLRQIGEVEPPKPSRMVAHAEEDIAVRRATTLGSLRKALRGDLDTITEKALRKKPERRYATANELAEDLSRHLGNRPIVAGTPGAGYRLRKFLRRHRAPVLVATIAGSVILGLVVTFIFALLAQVGRTEQEKVKAERLVTFLIETFAVSNPGDSVGETVTARELLDSGARRIAVELREQPDAQAMMLGAMGQIYLQIGMLEPARELQEQALEKRLAIPGAAPRDIVETRTHLGVAQAAIGQIDEAEATLLSATLEGRALSKRDRLIYARSLEALAQLRRRQYEYAEAEQLYGESLDLFRYDPQADAPGLARVQSGYGELLHEQGRFEEARAAHLASLATRRDYYGDQHPKVADSLQDLARLEHYLGRFAEARNLYQQALDIDLEIHGESHRTIADIKNGMALVLSDWGQTDEAAALLREAAELTLELSGATIEYATMASNLAVALTDLDQLGEAEELFHQALEIRQRSLGERHPLVGQVFLTLGRLYLRQGRLEAAEQRFAEAAQIARNLPPGHRAIAYPSLALAHMLLDQQRGAEAEVILRQALEELSTSHPAGHWRIALATADLGRALQMQGNLEEAETCLLQALGFLTAAASDHPARQQQVLGWIIGLYQQWGRPEKAAEYQARLGASPTRP